MAKSRKLSVQGVTVTYRKDEDGFFVWRKRIGGRSDKPKNVVVRRRDFTEFQSEVARVLRNVERHGVREEPTVAEFLPRYLRDYVKDAVARSTYQEKERLFHSQVSPFLGSIKLHSLTHEDVQARINDMHGAGLSRSYIRQTVTLLVGALERAKKLRYVTENVAKGVTLPMEQVKEVEALSPQEMTAVINEAYRIPPCRSTPSRYRHLIKFLFASGLRISEALGLRFEDYDQARRLLIVRRQLDWFGEGEYEFTPTKTRAGTRSIILEKDASEALLAQVEMVDQERQRLGEHYCDHGLVFPTEIGTPMRPRNVQRQFDAILARCGVRHVGLHAMRRTCLTNLANRGLSRYALAAYAGHSSPAVTDRYYVGVSIDTMRAAMEGLRPLEETYVSPSDSLCDGPSAPYVGTKPVERSTKDNSLASDQVQNGAAEAFERE